jgi:hypothetical protein
VTPSHDLPRGTGEYRETLMRIAGALAEIQIEHLPNMHKSEALLFEPALLVPLLPPLASEQRPLSIRGQRTWRFAISPKGLRSHRRIMSMIVARVCMVCRLYKNYSSSWQAPRDRASMWNTKISGPCRVLWVLYVLLSAASWQEQCGDHGHFVSHVSGRCSSHCLCMSLQ